MTDFLSPAERSDRMSRIRGKDTQPELALRKVLHRLGLRYRLHCAGLPGKPDLVFPRYRTAVFVHGCFWHRHDGCNIATPPKSNTPFWREKFEKNVARDARVTVWECELASAKKAQETGERIYKMIQSGAQEMVSATD